MYNLDNKKAVDFLLLLLFTATIYLYDFFLLGHRMNTKILLGVITIIALVSTATIVTAAYGYIVIMPDAPITASGDNVYVTW
jgi:hypothetical protein